MKNKLLLGNIIALAAYIIWGFLPLYWQLLSRVPSQEIIAHRIILSFVTLGVILLLQKRKNIWISLKDKKTRRNIIFAALALLINWSAFIIAVLANRVVECSLAYYINPLIVIAFGMLFLGEAGGTVKIIAIVLALIGVLILVFGYNQFPYFALIMAFSFSIYGLIKKRIKMDPYIGLFLEMLMILPFAFALQIFNFSSGTSVYLGQLGTVWFVVILMMSGLLTMLPLVLYNRSLGMITLGNMGFLQFLAPTIMFLIGVFINGEVFTTVHLISFIFIWLAVIIYCISLVVKSKNSVLLNKTPATE
jgi:chloramphenicol-sensitive protein RarD